MKSHAPTLCSPTGTGFVNIVLWPQVFARYATLVKTATFLGVTGTLQAEQGVVHLATAPSRNFQ